MDYSISDLGPYNLLFREAPALISDKTDKAIMRFVWDEYVARIRGKRLLFFPIKCRDVYRKTAIDRHTVAQHIETLEEIGLLIRDGDMYSVNGDYFLSLLKLYRSLQKQEDKDALRDAIANNDKDALEELGFELHEGITSVLSQMSGWVNTNPDGRELTQVGENSPTMVKTHPDGRILTHLGEIYTRWVGKIRAYVCENYTLNDIIEVFEQESGRKLAQVGVISPIYEIFSDSESLSDDAISILEIFAGSLLVQGGRKLTQGVGENLPTGGRDFTHSKKKEKEIEEKNEGDPEGPYNKGEDKDEIEKVDEGLIGDEIPRFNINEDLYKLAKKKAKLPYFNSQEVTEIINNIEVAIQREDKLFIHQLWEELSIYCTEEVDGDEIPRKIEGYEIFADQLDHILRPAFETTNEIIQQGYVSFNGEEIPVSIEKELDPEAVDLIIDWEKIKTEENTFVKVSQARLKNVYGEEVEAVRKKGRRRTDADRERINSYYRQFILAGNDQEKLDGLSDIECAIFDFIDQFFKVDWENGEITGLGDNFQERNFLTASEFNQFIFQVSDKYGITREDFLSVVNEKPDLDGNLTISERMLNVEGIQAWNKKHSQESSIKI